MATLLNDPAAIAKASADQLGWLLVICLRQDRYVEGTLAQAFDTGLFAAIARRAQILAGK
jgi:hypothetical protein